MIFSRDWFLHCVDQWTETLSEFRDTPCRVLEIGCFEGMSTCWLLQNICTHPESEMTCIDPWVDTDGLDGDETYARFLGNVSPLPRQPKVIRLPSFAALTSGLVRPALDVVYVDGDHMPPAALADIAITFDMLRVGGVAIWDDADIPWHPDPNVCEALKQTMEAFIAINSGRLEVLFRGKQIGVRRIA